MDANVFLDRLAPEAREVVSTLRRIIQRTVPEAEESVVWGCLSYHRPKVGGRVKGAVCQIVAKHGTVRLDFIHGIRLSDPAHLLRGSRVSKRHVVIASAADAERAEIVELFREAGALDPKKWV